MEEVRLTRNIVFSVVVWPGNSRFLEGHCASCCCCSGSSNSKMPDADLSETTSKDDLEPASTEDFVTCYKARNAAGTELVSNGELLLKLKDIQIE